MQFDRLKRRDFITLIGGAAAWPLAARAQQPMPIVGYINSGAPGPMAPLVSAFHEGLSQAGYVEGRNVAVEYRWSEGRSDRLPELAADLVGRRANAISTRFSQLCESKSSARSPSIPIPCFIACASKSSRWRHATRSRPFIIRAIIPLPAD
jgi:putative ABC transport system substrate-binding protein